MQLTRARILHIIKERRESTVDALSEELELTPATVRHHLDILRGKGLVTAPMVRKRTSPGRPQYAYSLTPAANEYFPKKYDVLANLLLAELSSLLSQEEIEQMLQAIGKHMAQEADISSTVDFETRLTQVVEYLNTQGYLARWESDRPRHYLVHIANCPFERVSTEHPEICKIDASLLEHLIRVPVQRVEWEAAPGHQCTYTVAPDNEQPF